MSLGPETQNLGLGLGFEHLSRDNKCGFRLYSAIRNNSPTALSAKREDQSNNLLFQVTFGLAVERRK